MGKQACKICKKITTKDKCDKHPEAKLVENWKGRVIIIDPANSELAKRMSITEKGEYAIRV
ncbi:MAG TPA: transcription elongation factor subunit Spt4 [Candidatus Nanoarchaeia archaeon]|nr:transcription elongation factor subunit Spt4 [Candidatus Nanoarchaeia archaeon]